MSEEIKKTDEELAKERLERYQKDPQSFIELKDVVMMSMRNTKSQIGISIFLGNAKRSELTMSLTEINHAVNKMMLRLDVESEMKNDIARNLVKPATVNILGAVDKYIKSGKN